MTNSGKNNKIINYFTESYQELKKVTWPTRNQAVRLTFIVLGFCLFAAFVMGVLDLAFNTSYRFLVDYAAKVVPPTPITTPIDANPGVVTSEAPVKTAPDAITGEAKIKADTSTQASTQATAEKTGTPKDKVK